MMVNAYYDFKNDSSLTPFVGVGLGGWHNNSVKNTEFAWSLMAGAKYQVTSNIYVGAKASYFRLGGSSIPDSGTLKTADSNAYVINASVGYEF